MTRKLGDSFIRSVIKNVEDCSTPIQLRTYLRKYEDYVFSPAIQNVFKRRIEEFKEIFIADKLYLLAIEDIEDILDVNIQITKQSKLFSAYQEKNHKKTVRALMADETKGVKKLRKK
jgi:hypothetical protein